MVWDIDPEIFRLGPIAVRWYSMAFIIGFMTGYQYILKVFHRNNVPETAEKVSSLFTHVFLGTIIGARLGHCLFYEPSAYLSAPWKILFVWEGGLASHGGFLGVITAIILYIRKQHDFSCFWLLDRIAPAALLTGSLIRVGNFFNSEIIGKPTDVPWAVIFKRIDGYPRHPSMLYESALYFIIAIIGFFLIEKFRHKWKEGAFVGYILVFGMIARFIVEFTKENQVAFEGGLPINMGQILSLPFIMLGIYLMTGKQSENPALNFFTKIPSKKKGK